MQISPLSRSVAAGAVAAVVVVGAYAFGHAGSSGVARAAATSSNPPITNTADTPATGNGIQVSGTGRVTGTPDLLRLQASVQVTKPDVDSAMQGANTTMAAVQAALKADGVAAADLQTSGLSVQPNYDYSNNSAPKITGYVVSENLSVVLRHLSTAGTTITDIAQAGGDALRIDGASLDIDDDSALLSQARVQAFADAKAKADAYAKAAGHALGDVVTISEASTSQPQPVYVGDMAKASAASAPVPLQAGSQDVTVTVTVRWSIG
jgi:uncharacterized protein YggE